MYDLVRLMRELSLRPYHGKILLCDSPAEFKRIYRKRVGERCPFDFDPNGGFYCRLMGAKGVRYLVWACDVKVLAHELCHVLFHAFDQIGAHPGGGGGEPFCYMLSQLLSEATDG